MKQMFYQAWSFNRDLSPWNVAGVTTMYRMFFEATAFDQVLCWDVANANTVEMFLGSSGSVSPTCQADGEMFVETLEREMEESCAESAYNHHRLEEGG